MNPLNDCFWRGFAEYHVSQEDGEMRASFTQALKRFVACWFDLDKRRRTFLTWQLRLSGTAYIFLLVGSSSMVLENSSVFHVEEQHILYHPLQIKNWKNIYGVGVKIPAPPQSPEIQDENRDWTTHTAVALGGEWSSLKVGGNYFKIMKKWQ